MAKKVDWKRVNRDGDRIVFRQQMEKLGFKSSELAILLDRTPRCIGYYINGKRGISAAIWLKMKRLQETSRDVLYRKIARVKKRK